MKSTEFVRFAVEHTGMLVSVCPACTKFIAAAPDPVYLCIAEHQHLCSGGMKKPSRSVGVNGASLMPLPLAKDQGGCE